MVGDDGVAHKWRLPYQKRLQAFQVAFRACNVDPG